MSKLTQLPVWQALKAHYQAIQGQHLRDWFAQDPGRGEQLKAELAGLSIDYSKQRIIHETLKLLTELAACCELEENIARLFSGYPLNNTEQRAAWHTALREQDPKRLKPEVKATLTRMAELTTALHAGEWRGFSGKAISDIVHIGIGGSDLGPRLVTEALASFHIGPLHSHFVSNVDADELMGVLQQVQAKSTLFIVTSKTFTTQETLLNASTAKHWLSQHTDQFDRHFIAITANPSAATAFGIAEQNILPLWDWVGGRYSLWSAVGLPIALSIGMAHFQALLQGAYTVDQHFQNTPIAKNLPVLLGLIDIWNINFGGACSLAILPYAQRLQYLPAYLQQLMMESNGKCVDKNNQPVDYDTGAIVWGGVETNGQHAFHQLLMQGGRFIPSDIIIPLTATHDYPQHQKLLVANGLAQAKALMQGREEKAAAYKNVPGNQPSNTIGMQELNPSTLGALIALYEHRTFVQSVIWNINAFDQWGVELGKLLTKQMLEAI